MLRLRTWLDEAAVVQSWERPCRTPPARIVPAGLLSTAHERPHDRGLRGPPARAARRPGHLERLRRLPDRPGRSTRRVHVRATGPGAPRYPDSTARPAQTAGSPADGG